MARLHHHHSQSAWPTFVDQIAKHLSKNDDEETQSYDSNTRLIRARSAKKMGQHGYENTYGTTNSQLWYYIKYIWCLFLFMLQSASTCCMHERHPYIAKAKATSHTRFESSGVSWSRVLWVLFGFRQLYRVISTWFSATVAKIAAYDPIADETG